MVSYWWQNEVSIIHLSAKALRDLPLSFISAPHVHLCPSPIDHTHSRHYVKLCALPVSGISFPSSLPIKSYSRSPCKGSIPLSWPAQSCEGSLGCPSLGCLQSCVYTTIRTAIFLLHVVDFYVCLGLPAKNTWHLVKLSRSTEQFLV